jgi:hypothetical protein
MFSNALIVLLTIAFSPSKVACKNPPGVGYTVEENNLLDKLVFAVINSSLQLYILLLVGFYKQLLRVKTLLSTIQLMH